MNLKKHWNKHALTIIIIGFFAFLAAGSTISAPEKTVKAFKEGDYAKAKKIGEASPDVKSVNDMVSAEARWYLGEIYYKEGDVEKALESKIKAYNYVMGSSSKQERCFKDNPDFYYRMINDPQINEQLAIQEKEQKKRAAAEVKKQYVGTWSFYTVNKDGKSYNRSNLLRYPKQVVFKENGTGYVNTPTTSGADSHSDFTWDLVDGKLSTSLSGMKLGMNKSGYIVCSWSAIKYDMGLERVDIFFTKE